jgi:hypothetical protein
VVSQNPRRSGQRYHNRQSQPPLTRLDSVSRSSGKISLLITHIGLAAQFQLLLLLDLRHRTRMRGHVHCYNFHRQRRSCEGLELSISKVS